MSHQLNSQMREAIARALRFRERMPNTLAAGYAAMDTEASIMHLVAAAGLTLGYASGLDPELPTLFQPRQLQSWLHGYNHGRMVTTEISWLPERLFGRWMLDPSLRGSSSASH